MQHQLKKREESHMKTVRVAAAIIRSGDKIFATQRGYGEFKDGWEFPGGKIESGETPQEALVREIREELDNVGWLPADLSLIEKIREQMKAEESMS